MLWVYDAVAMVGSSSGTPPEAIAVAGLVGASVTGKSASTVRAMVGEAEVGAAEGGCSGGQCAVGSTRCFIAGTKINTERGPISIEQIEIGDKVWSRNLSTGRDELQPVVQTYVRYADHLVRLTIAGAVLTTTEDHPFMVQGRGWTKAGKLRPGDPLVTPWGTTPLVATAPQATGATVYNFQVAVNHDYYPIAGITPVLVHNANYPIPNVIHDAVDAIREGALRPRTTPGGEVDIFTVRPNTPGSIARKWGGSTIYGVPGKGNRFRVLVNQYGDIGWIDDHDYTKIMPYTPKSQ